MGLARNEEALCSEHGVDPDHVVAAELSTPRTSSEPKAPPQKTAPPQPASSTVLPQAEDDSGFAASAHFTGARPGWVFKLGPMGLGYYREERRGHVIEDGLTWEALLSAPPQGEVGSAWVGPFGMQVKQDTELKAPPAKETPSGSSLRPQYPTPKRLFDLQGSWVDKETPVGQIQGGCVVWHPSYNSRPTRLVETDEGGVEMEMEQKIYTATIDWGPPAQLRWSDGEVWSRCEAAPQKDEQKEQLQMAQLGGT
ncbi:unnamed protein product [Durusdinium trenchii]|uniref:Uncharacterized protein n=1 Tax=Durusdinium trenchii TaxID=1381693 RepID=A0ABP0NXM1_9DINO